MIYLDYNATSPIHPKVCTAMAPFFQEAFGNASSLHAKGRQARDAVESVRMKIVEELGDHQGQLLFTSGGTEANNLALKGFCHAFKSKGDHLIVSSIEHHAVLHVAKALSQEGFQVSLVPVDSYGVIDLDDLKKSIRPTTILISVMHANNEVGTIQPIEEVATIAKEYGILFHTDAVQSFGKLELDVRAIGVDLVSLSAHKLGGPKGVGALYVRQGIRIHPLLHGGPHEKSMRAGTENVPGIVGMGAALEVTSDLKQKGLFCQVQRWTDRLETGLKERISDIQINGHPSKRLPGTLNVSFLGASGETLLMVLDLAGICVSTGSACSSGSTEPSHVLVAMGLSPSRLESSIRFSLGWGTTEIEIEECLEKIPAIVSRIREAQVRAQ